jgi:glyoxylase-like metal-dependent hydrolase (beta-lactamase superfamily II)
MSLIPKAVLEPTPRNGLLGSAAILVASALKLLRDAIDARACMVTGHGPTPSKARRRLAPAAIEGARTA